MKSATCRHCAFAVETRVGDNIQTVLQCRLNPPAPAAIPVAVDNRGMQVQVQMLRPIMDPDDWCSQQEPREEPDGDA